MSKPSKDYGSAFLAYGPGPRATDHTAIVLERNASHTTCVTLYAEETRRLELVKIANQDFEQWWAPTPDVPVKVLAELYRAHARRLGATPEALHVIRQFVDITHEEISYMTSINTPKERAVFSPETGTTSVAPKKTKEKTPVKKASERTPAPKKAAAPKNEIFKFVKAPKDGVKIAPQAKTIVAILEKAGAVGLPTDKLLEKMSKEVTTKQPIERILSYYRKQLVDDGYVKAVEA